DDDFLALGGDSISAIRMASALKKRGLAITTSALFDARTIAAIAAAAEPIAESGAPQLVDAGADTGWIPLGPIAALLTERPADTYRAYSQATTVVTPADATAGKLAQMLRGLVDRHPLLRARIGTDPAGVAAYYVPGPGEPFDYPALTEVELDPAAWARTAADTLAEQLRTTA
ncbi:phosphopantetheine-binding protein, partial [Nocardia farcinica]